MVSREVGSRWKDGPHLLSLGERLDVGRNVALGLGRFGDNTWAERAVWLLGIYLVIAVFANLWMSKFSMGPLEWVWRVFTYWRIPKA